MSKYKIKHKEPIFGEKVNYKLTEGHPTLEKLSQIFDLAEKLGIMIDFSYGNCEVIVTDKDQKEWFYLQDTDQSTPLVQIPAFSEYKLIYSK